MLRISYFSKSTWLYQQQIFWSVLQFSFCSCVLVIHGAPVIGNEISTSIRWQTEVLSIMVFLALRNIYQDPIHLRCPGDHNQANQFYLCFVLWFKKRLPCAVSAGNNLVWMDFGLQEEALAANGAVGSDTGPNRSKRSKRRRAPWAAPCTIVPLLVNYLENRLL